MFQTEVVQKIKAHVLCSVTFSENCAVYEIMWKNAVEATDDNMARALCMLDDYI
jgi:transcription initiation factor IIE alpha subunit